MEISTWFFFNLKFENTLTGSAQPPSKPTASRTTTTTLVSHSRQVTVDDRQNMIEDRKNMIDDRQTTSSVTFKKENCGNIELNFEETGLMNLNEMKN